MTSRLPSNRLVDILRQNNERTLRHHAEEFANAYASIPPEALQTRFLRNHFLISPKSLYLLTEPDTLARFGTFAIYKPPFCPMRRAEAKDNYHHVSVESYVTAALKSRNIFPVLRDAGYPLEGLTVRVLNDVAAFESGPVVVSVADGHSFVRSLDPFTMRYDVLVAGHLPITTTPKPIDTKVLFPSAVSAPDTDSAASTKGVTVCTYAVKLNGYYAVHAVSLLEIVVQAPPTALPPAICPFVASHLGSFVMGDPVTMGEYLSDGGRARAASAASASSTAPAAAGRAPLNISKGVVMRGDCDLPRVFSHLREVSIAITETDARGRPVTAAPLEFHCRKCFDPLIKRHRESSLKAVQIRLLDGSWTPEAEYL